jgi:hypothetical protein
MSKETLSTSEPIQNETPKHVNALEEKIRKRKITSRRSQRTSTS